MAKTLQATLSVPSRNIDPDMLLKIKGERRLQDLPEMFILLGPDETTPTALEIFIRYYSTMGLVVFDQDYRLSPTAALHVVYQFDQPQGDDLLAVLHQQQVNNIELSLENLEQLGSQFDTDVIRAALASSTRTAFKENFGYLTNAQASLHNRVLECFDSSGSNKDFAERELDDETGKASHLYGLEIRQHAIDNMVAADIGVDNPNRVGLLESYLQRTYFMELLSMHLRQGAGSAEAMANTIATHGVVSLELGARDYREALNAILPSSVDQQYEPWRLIENDN